MPHLRFPLSSDGMVVQAVFGLNGADTAALLKSKQPVPRPVQLRALVDSGADVTAVSPQAIQRLGLPVFGYGTNQTAGGAVRVNL